jgi:hypothetical protein
MSWSLVCLFAQHEPIELSYLTLEEVTHEEVVVHGIGDDLGNRLRRHFDVGIVLGSARLHISRDPKKIRRSTYLPVSCKTDLGDVSELGKVLLHLVLVETMGNSTEVEGTLLGVLIVSIHSCI